MNLQEIQSLSDDKLRIKVAELCDYEFYEPTEDEPGQWVLPNRRGAEFIEFGLFLDKDGEDIIPDFINDRNAIEEAKSQFSDNMKIVYVFNLACEVLNLELPTEDNDWTTLQIYDLMHATPRQQAEAFVLTKTEWSVRHYGGK